MSIARTTLVQALLAFFIIAIPFGTRVAVRGGGAYAPYDTIFLYAADIAAFCLFVAIAVKKNNGAGTPWLLFIPALAGFALFILIGGVSALQSGDVLLGYYTLARVALFGTLAFFLARNGALASGKMLAVPIFLVGISQAALAWFQFLAQRSIGLAFLGEQALGADIAGVAKLDIAGEKIIRAYGTFPHPNALAAFLALSFFVSAAWFVQHPPRRAVFAALWLWGFALMGGAALFTFSRGGWLGSAAGLAVCAAALLRRRHSLAAQEKQRLAAVAIVLAFVAAFALLFFRAELLSRAVMRLDEQAVAMRIESGYWAAKEIDAHKFTGVGPGQFVQNIARYAGELPERWMYQPAHSIYALIAAEYGLFGLLAFLSCIGFILLAWLRRESGGLLRIAGLASFVAFLAMGLFDHYFLTFGQGIAAFWTAAALVLAY